MPDRGSTTIDVPRTPPQYAIGTFVDQTAPRFPGKMHHRKGFGIDLTREVEIALLTTAALQPPGRRLFDARHFMADNIREDYRSNLIRWYGHSGISLADSRLHQVTDHLGHLCPQRTYRDLHFGDVQHPPQQPHLVTVPSRPTYLSWRHFTFANLVVAERLPHLRTVEMQDPDIVWNRLLTLFQDYCALVRQLSFLRLSEKERRREMISGYLAFYERLLYLWYAATTRQPEFLNNILQRRPEPTVDEDQILALNSGTPLPTLEGLLTIRHQVYLDTVQNLLHRSVDQLIRLTPNRS